MKIARTVAVYVLIGLIVISLGALAGWYFVLRSKSADTSLADAARGFGSDTPLADQNGSTFQNSNSSFSSGGGSRAAGGLPVGDSSGSGGGGDTSGTASDGVALEGGTTNDSATSTVKASSTNEQKIKIQTPRLWHISKTPVAGADFSDASTSVIYYAERLGGYIFRANIITGEIFRLTNTLKPKTYEAQFTRTGAALLRSIQEKTGTITTFTGTVASSTSSSPGTLLGQDLENNILDIAGDADTGTIFFLIRAPSGGSFGITSLWNGSKEKRVFTSPLASWRLFKLSDGRNLVVQKAHDGIAGYAYEITKSGGLTPVVRNVPGLTIRPLANSPALLYGSSDGMSLFLKGADAKVTTLQIKTTADKCVWAPYPSKIPRGTTPHLYAYCAVPEQLPAQFLEGWYQGAIHTTDSWWRVDGRTGDTHRVYTPSQDLAIDVIDPRIDPTGEFISFKNNDDATLWMLRIEP